MHDFVTSAACAIPGAVERGEDIAFVFGWKLLAAVKTKIERRRVRLHENVGHNNFARKIDPPVGRIRSVANMLSFVAGGGGGAAIKKTPTTKNPTAFN